MNIYNAIMKAADHIERNPDLFSFSPILIPDCGTPGCALGWIGHFADCRSEKDGGLRSISLVSLTPYERGTDVIKHLGYEHPLLGDVTTDVFYDRMLELAGGYEWKRDAAVCARALRLYAEKYHKPKAPDWNAIAAKWTIGDDVRSQEIAA